MQTFITLLISYLLATITLASPIFPARPIRKDLKDIGHSVGSIIEDAFTEPEHHEACSKPASSGWAAPSTWKGDKEWHTTGKVAAPSGHMPEHKAPQWHSTGFAAPSAHFPQHHASIGTGIPHKMPIKPKNASFPAPTASHFAHGAGQPHLSTAFVPKATGFTHRKLQVNSTAGVWPSGAALPSGASRPSGAAWHSGKATFSFSTGAVPLATGSKPVLRLNATSAQIFATGTAVSMPKLFSNGTAFSVHIPSGTAPSVKTAANGTTPAIALQTAPSSIVRSTAGFPKIFANATTAPELLNASSPSAIVLSTGAVRKILSNATTAPELLTASPSAVVLSTGAAPTPRFPANATAPVQLLTASSPSVALATAPKSVVIANANLSSMAIPTAPSTSVVLATAPAAQPLANASSVQFPTAPLSNIVLASAPTPLSSANATSVPIKLATASSPSIILSTAAVPRASVNFTTPALATGTVPVSKFIPLETVPASDFHTKISASSVVIKHLSADLPSTNAPASTGEAARLKPHFAILSGTVLHSHIKAPASTAELPQATEKAASVTASHMHLATVPAEISVVSETPSSTTWTTKSTVAPSATAPSSPSFQHSAKTKEIIHKSPGAPCSPDEKLQCKGESMYGHCQFHDGHWRWYWADVKDGYYCQDGAVHKSLSGSSSSSWGGSGSSW